MNAKKLLEHLQNICAQGHGDAEVIVQNDVGFLPLYSGDIAHMSNNKKALILQPREDALIASNKQLGPSIIRSN